MCPAMRGPLRLLACADLETTLRLEAALDDVQVVQLCGRASSGGEMLAQFRALRPDLVLIAGDVDGCHGVRIAAALARERPVPTVLLVERGAQDDARDEVDARGVDAHLLVDGGDETSASILRTTLQLMATRVLPLVQPEPTLVRPHLAVVARSGFDALVLVGSAGTPHMLPDLLGPRPPSAVPLVVAVHHNPRMSEAFCAWVGELVGLEPHPLGHRVLDLQPLHVAEASAQGGDAGLEPDLAAVVDHVVGAGRRVLVCVASGMGLTALDALRRVRGLGGVVVALDPSTCSQPAMSAAVLAAGLADHVVSLPELAWLLGRAPDGNEGSTRQHADRLPHLRDVRLAASM
jgi:two-component system chemotaxis response regulator CheB